VLLEPSNGRIGRLFDRDKVARTIRARVSSQDTGSWASGGREAARKRLAEAEARLRRFQDAIGAGDNPAALVEAINDAQAQRAATRAGRCTRAGRADRRRDVHDDRFALVTLAWRCLAVDRRA
jgi:hypothetical protein